MLFQNCRFSSKRRKRHKVGAQKYLDSQIKLSKFSSKLRYFILRLNIARKIGYGYALAIGIAVLGTTVGLLGGDYYQEHAQKQLNIANEQQHLFSDLEAAVDAVRSHPQRLVTVLGQSIWFDYEKAKFKGNLNQVKILLIEIELFIDKNPHSLATHAIEIKNILNDYEANISIYTQLTQSLWQQIDPSNFKSENIQVAQQKLLTSLKGETATSLSIRFDRLTEHLTKLKRAAAAQQMQANEKVEQAKTLRRQIIAGSMLLSVAIAIVLALVTSRAIAYPLEALTAVARAVTQDGNFALQAPVTTEDEVGSLAASLNQLVKWVGEHTKALELARQTLEQRVEDRTQELQTALENLKQTQAQLIQTEKMSGLGQLVSGVAHEINNPINFIYGNLTYANAYTQDLLKLIELYQQQYSQPTAAIQEQLNAIDLDFIRSDLPKVLSSMEMGTERIKKIVVSLRNFSRLDEAEVKAVDIHEGIDNTLLILNHRLKQGICVTKNYEKLPLISCHPAQINQVFMNILVNAIDALAIKESQVEKQILIQTEKINEHEICIVIWNNGKEIPSSIKDRLFDPFFTTKPVGQGTGLGLTICYQIVEKHAGKIEVFSESGRGTEFVITLPIHRKVT